MCSRWSLFLATAFPFLVLASAAQAALDGVADSVQSEDDVTFDGTAYLIVEGESAAELSTVDGEDNGYLVVDNINPIQTATTFGDPPQAVNKGGLDVLPADTNAYGGAAIFDQIGGALQSGKAIWEVQFALPGTYYVYAHWSVYNRDNTTNYLNEDSFYMSPAFNMNSTTDWIDYEGQKWESDPPGDLFGGAPGAPFTGDGKFDGYVDGFPVLTQILNNGIPEVENASTTTDFWDGNFNWSYISRANDYTPENTFISFDGLAFVFEVTEDDLGQPLTLEISTREPSNAIDALIFTTSPSLLQDFSQANMDSMFNTIPGDADQDRDVDFDDIPGFVLGLNDPVLYESLAGVPSLVTSDTDLDGDHDFDDIDSFVAILGSGGEASTVPEPTALALALMASAGAVFAGCRRKTRRNQGSTRV